MRFELEVVYPGDCMALLALDVTSEGPRACDWEVNEATLLKLTSGGAVTSKGWNNGSRIDWKSLPLLNISLDPIEIAAAYETQIADGLIAAKDDDDAARGDYLYEQEKDRRLGL